MFRCEAKLMNVLISKSCQILIYYDEKLSVAGFITVKLAINGSGFCYHLTAIYNQGKRKADDE